MDGEDKSASSIAAVVSALIDFVRFLHYVFFLLSFLLLLSTLFLLSATIALNFRSLSADLLIKVWGHMIG